MTAEQLLKEGRLEEALKILQQAVRERPEDAKLRVFLFQLLSVLGDWPKANNQLRILAELDSESLLLARLFEPVLLCEAFRADVFAGRRTPLVFGEPPDWIGSLVKAVEHFGRGEFEAGIAQRNRAFEEAPAAHGKIDDQPFQWLADADERLGPVLEVLLEGRYYWIPFQRICRIVLEPATDLRDLVWTPAQFVWENGGQAFGHIPTRYPDTDKSDDNALRLARKTEWTERSGIYLGCGQRVLATDSGEYPLLEIRNIEFAGSAD
jgi:type VI secretion system protein ImpE